MNDFKITEHFSFFELTNSNSQYGLVDENRLVALKYLHKLHYGCLMLLEPIRYWAGPLIITSGFRFQKLNSAVNGSERSQHILGEAFDFKPINKSVQTVFDWLKTKPVNFGQLKNGKTFIHISLGAPFRPKEFSNEVMG